ncbi:MAG: hypothetical protein ACI4EJ_07920 [Bacteroides sp.]
MDINIINKIVKDKLLNDIDTIIEYNEIGIYHGIEGCLEYIQQLTGCDKDTAIKIIDEYEELKPSSESIADYEHRTIVANTQAQELLNKPKCPTCNSTNIKKISTTAKVAGAVTFGLLSKNATSQFKCNNCGYKW